MDWVDVTDLETLALSISLMRTLLVGTLIFSVSGIVMGILQSFNHFIRLTVLDIQWHIQQPMEWVAETV